MTYPKEVMTTKELLSMGFSKNWLTWVSTRYGQKVCWKMTGAKNSKQFWSTEELEKVRKNLCVGRFPGGDIFNE